MDEKREKEEEEAWNLDNGNKKNKRKEKNNKRKTEKNKHLFDEDDKMFRTSAVLRALRATPRRMTILKSIPRVL